MRKLFPAITLISLIYTGSAIAQENQLSEPLKEEKKSIEETQALSKEERKKAEKVADQQSLAIWNDVDPFFEAKAKCFNLKEDVDIELCLLKAYETLAEAGNFVAQDFLGKLYLNYHKNTPMAIEWFKKALNNPRTPAKYKYGILEDLEALEKEVSQNKTEEADGKPISEELKKIIKDIKASQELVTLEKRKAQLLKDESQLQLLSAAEEHFNVRSKCLEKPNEHAITICLMESVKKLAESGNFYAQHQLGNVYEIAYHNKHEAIMWYKKALENPKTPLDYKPKIEEDLKRVQESESEKNSDKPETTPEIKPQS